MEKEQVPAFDFRRWGVGGIVMVGFLLASGIAAFVEGLLHESVGLQIIGTVCLGGCVLVFVVKIGEEIHPVSAKWGIVGEVGEVVSGGGNGTRGTVRVRSELWSATSEAFLRPGTKVRVVRVEGLLAWVKKLDEDDGRG